MSFKIFTVLGVNEFHIVNSFYTIRVNATKFSNLESKGAFLEPSLFLNGKPIEKVIFSS